MSCPIPRLPQEHFSFNKRFGVRMITSPERTEGTEPRTTGGGTGEGRAAGAAAELRKQPDPLQKKPSCEKTRRKRRQRSPETTMLGPHSTRVCVGGTEARRSEPGRGLQGTGPPGRITEARRSEPGSGSAGHRYPGAGLDRCTQAGTASLGDARPRPTPQ